MKHLQAPTFCSCSSCASRRWR